MNNPAKTFKVFITANTLGWGVTILRRLAVAKFAVVFLLFGCGKVESDSASGDARPAVRPVSVAVEPITQGAISDERVFTGTLLPERRFTVAARTSGLVQRLDVHVGDRVTRNQVIGILQSDELQEEVAQARANLEVARANLQLAASELMLTQREWDRIRSLQDRDFVSAAERDRVESLLSAREAGKRVAESTLLQREAALRSAEIRLEYATLRASWEGADAERFVSRRFLDEGSLAANNSPIVEVISLDPLIGQFYVTEADFHRIKLDMPVSISTSAHGPRVFEGRVRGKAPEFSADTRRALVEVTVDNPEILLAPGVFMRAAMVLGEAADAILVPATAIVRRGQRDGVFLIDEAQSQVRFHAIERGFQEQGRVAVQGIPARGWVVVLGHDRLTDGTPVSWSPPVTPAEGERGSGRGGRSGRSQP